MLQTVVETPEYIKQANSCMDNISRGSFLNYIAAHPIDGDLIAETGGARKIRWTSNSHQGKRCQEKKLLKKIIKPIVQTYGEEHHE